MMYHHKRVLHFIISHDLLKKGYYGTGSSIKRYSHLHISETNNEEKNDEAANINGQTKNFTKFSFHRSSAAIATSALLLIGGFIYHFNSHHPFLPLPFINNCLLEEKLIEKKQDEPTTSQLEPPERPDLPIISLEDVKKHGRNSDQIWVTYKKGIYDITNFVKYHPGGDKILMAAGGSIEPFWIIYAQHKTSEVMEILEELRIGNLSKTDLQAAQRTMLTEDDPYYNDPQRHPALLINSHKPFNAETPASLLIDSFNTPNQLFFVRNHMPVPQTDQKTHRISIEGLGIEKTISLTVNDLRENFEPHKIISAIQCAGNRRSEMNNFKKVQGLMWTGTAISNAEWTGCRLRDVLISAGVQPDDKRIKHVHFEGADVDSIGKSYGASITFEKAMGPEVILAYEMNGELLPRDHGHPIRIIAPGIVGARQVKWLTNIRTSNKESESHWQQRDYKAMPSSFQIGEELPFDSTPSIQEYPVQSAICLPSPNTKIPANTKTINVSGYAWSGGGRGIIRVEVSADGGKTWKCADLHQCPEQDLEHMWAWTLWTLELSIPNEAYSTGNLELLCKATDRAYNTQPESSNGIWNVRGLLYNAWHRVMVVLEQ